MKLIRYLIYILISIATATSIFYLFKKDTNPISSNENELIIGTTSGYAPFVSLTPEGNYEGFDIDFAKELAKKLNKKLVIKDLGNMSSLFIALRQNKIDAIIWAVSITSERQKEFAMIHYQGDELKSLPLVFWKKIPVDIKSIEDLKKYPNSSICVEPASSNEKFLSKFEFIKLKPIEKIADGIMDIKYGRSLATLVDPSLIDDLKQKYPEIQILEVPLTSEWRVLGNGVVIRKNNTELISQIEKVVNSLKKDGTIANLQNKWNVK